MKLLERGSSHRDSFTNGVPVKFRSVIMNPVGSDRSEEKKTILPLIKPLKSIREVMSGPMIEFPGDIIKDV